MPEPGHQALALGEVVGRGALGALLPEQQLLQKLHHCAVELRADHLLAVAAALRLQADVRGVALRVGGVGGHDGRAGERPRDRRGLAQVLLAGAVLLKVHQAAAGDAAHLQGRDCESSSRCDAYAEDAHAGGQVRHK